MSVSGASVVVSDTCLSMQQEAREWETEPMAESMANDSMDVRIARMEEQMGFMSRSLHDFRIQYAEDMIDLKRTVNITSDGVQRKQDDHARQDEERYVTKIEWYPVRNLVYGMVGLIGATLIGAIMAALVGIKVVH